MGSEATPATLITGEDVRTYVGRTAGDAADADYATSVAQEANDLVAAYVGAHEVPDAVGRRARLEVASELYHRRSAPNGIAQFATPDGSPVRVARDPMLGAYPLLDRYLPGGFA